MPLDSGYAPEDAKRFGRIVAKAWSDDAFKRRLLNDPKAVLQEHGIEVPAGAEVKIVENTDQVVYVNLPRQPRERLADAAATVERRPMLCYWSVCCSTRDW